MKNLRILLAVSGVVVFAIGVAPILGVPLGADMVFGLLLSGYLLVQGSLMLSV